MAEPIRIVHYGLGPIGLEIAGLATRKPALRAVAAVDVDPQKAGRSLSELAGLPAPSLLVAPDLRSALVPGQADVAIHCTGSHLRDVHPQLVELLEAGLNVVSTCEELSYPWMHHPELARHVDELARRRGVTVLGTGVNPGFVMDTLPIVLSGTCQEVNRVHVTRILDASTRRLPLQRKIGAGLPIAEFEALVSAGKLRHVGLTESLGMLADALQWPLDGVEESTSPVVTTRPIQTEFVQVQAGQVAGVRQLARGIQGGCEVITLTLEMYVGADEPHDRIVLDSMPPIDVTIKNSVHGDRATAAIVVNVIPRLVEMPPGLITMKELPPFPAMPSAHR